MGGKHKNRNRNRYAQNERKKLPWMQHPEEHAIPDPVLENENIMNQEVEDYEKGLCGNLYSDEIALHNYYNKRLKKDHNNISDMVDHRFLM